MNRLMISKLNLPRNTIRIIRFIFGFGLFMYFDWDRFNEDAVGLMIKSAIISLFLVIMTEFTDSLGDEGHVIYSSLALENEIVDTIESLDFTLKSSVKDLSIYTKPKRWGTKKIKIVKTEHFIKIEVPENFVAQFEKFVR